MMMMRLNLKKNIILMMQYLPVIIIAGGYVIYMRVVYRLRVINS